MTRLVRVGAAQMGPVQRADRREQTVERLITLLHQARAADCEFFPEAALCSFFPHWDVQDEDELDVYFEREPRDDTEIGAVFTWREPARKVTDGG